jgi:flavin-dependent dehydrogenase
MHRQFEHSSCGKYDVAVVGGGPSGAAVALCIARLGWEVVLLEASAGDTPRYGETLPPECNPVLRSLGLWETFKHSGPLESPGIISCWGRATPAQKDFLGNVYGAGWHLDRIRFDAELRSEAARLGVTVRCGERVTVVHRQNGWWRFNDIEARFVVDATGRNGLRLDLPATREIDDNLLVRIVRMAYPNGRPSDLRTLIVASPCGWWYWTPVPDGTSIAMFFTCLEEYLTLRLRSPGDCAQTAPAIYELLRSAYILESQWISVSSSLREVVYGEGWIAVGDSGSCYDPLSGRGIFNAFRCAPMAAEAVNSALRGRSDGMIAFESAVRSEFGEYRKLRKICYREEQRWLLSPFWRGRHR